MDFFVLSLGPLENYENIFIISYMLFDFLVIEQTQQKAKRQSLMEITIACMVERQCLK